MLRVFFCKDLLLSLEKQFFFHQQSFFCKNKTIFSVKKLFFSPKTTVNPLKQFPKKLPQLGRLSLFFEQKTGLSLGGGEFPVRSFYFQGARWIWDRCLLPSGYSLTRDRGPWPKHFNGFLARRRRKILEVYWKVH